MKLKQLVFYIVCLTALVAMPGYAQDVLPECPKPDKHSSPVYSSHEMKQLMQFVSVDSPMPAVFRNTTENELTDPAGSLHPFWEKLGALDRPLRIVHIGDSHVRGHVFPYVMRCSLEDDFGSKAVENIPVTYQTSGIARETGSNGVVYHILGVNGATCQSFSTPEHIRQIADLHPDLVMLVVRNQRSTRAALQRLRAYRRHELSDSGAESLLSRCRLSDDYPSGSLCAEWQEREDYQPPYPAGRRKRTEVRPRARHCHLGHV